MDLRVYYLDLIKNRSHLARRKRGVSQIRTELIERLLKVDVVLPEGVVSIKDEMLRLQTKFYCSACYKAAFACPFSGATLFASAICCCCAAYSGITRTRYSRRSTSDR